MPEEKQVCSPELSLKLKELGVPQESLLRWYKGFTDTDWYCDLWSNWDDYEDVWVSAFTVAELGELLPCNLNIKSRKQMQWLTWQNNKHVHTVAYVGSRIENPALQEHAKTEADARAKMLIYLIENKLITI